jgi:DNA-binding response OmpR family regulator
MLPHVSGVNLCQHYRALGKTAPILMTMARDTTYEKVTGLDAGADDYLVKPIDLIEFMARVRALRRRSPLSVGDTLNLEDLHLHLDSLTIERQGKTVTLSSREFQLLEHFMRHPRQILTRNQIEQAIWEWGTEPDSNAMTVLVRKLRQRLQAVEARDWVESIYGMGYWGTACLLLKINLYLNHNPIRSRICLIRVAAISPAGLRSQWVAFLCCLQESSTRLR